MVDPGEVLTAAVVDKTRSHQVGHYALPEEYARLVVLLAGPLNTWLVGSTVAADGGTLSAGGWYRTRNRWTNQPLLVQHLEEPGRHGARPPAVQ